MNLELYTHFFLQDEVNCLKIQAYDELDNIVFDHEMKDNYPVPLSSTLNTGLNPPDLHVTCQGKALVLSSCLPSDTMNDDLICCLHLQFKIQL